MELIESISKVVANIAIFFSAIFASYHLRLVHKSYTSIHDWNRRKAAQDLTMDLNKIIGNTEILHQKLQFINKKQPIPLDAIINLIEENPIIQLKLQKVLNIYNSVSRGVIHGVYDESIIKKARKKTMIQTYSAFSNYINYRRNESIDTLWSDFEALTLKWQSELRPTELRKLTDN